jgi:hypothetical protein
MPFFGTIWAINILQLKMESDRELLCPAIQFGGLDLWVAVQWHDKSSGGPPIGRPKTLPLPA